PAQMLPAQRDGYGDPLVPRLLLGRRLRDLRESRGMTRADAARAVQGSPSKLTRIEMGRVGLRSDDITELLAAYGIRDEFEYSTLLTLAEQTRARPWWHDHRDVVPDGMGAYLSAEQAAKLVRRFEVGYIPELLRTEAYARELILRGVRADDDVRRRLDLLAQRQRWLRRR
ncbi:Scr1 family TA system antitoxin-like transcriptional regulator, partial [Actinomadura adrarensis]